jgi:tetratricopeptide (TPR) repeat protein
MLRPILILLAVGYIGFTIPLLPVGTDDIRMANVFSIDESDIAAEIWNLYVVGLERKPAFKYGGLFYYIPVMMLHVWSVFAPVSEHALLLVLRLFCSISGAGCLWLVYRIGREMFDEKVGVIATFLLLAMPTFLRWTVESHPDLPQLFWILLSVLYAMRYTRSFTLRDVCLAAVSAGFAFGTKFGGIFLLPALGIALFISLSGTGLLLNLKDKRRWVGGGVLILGFCSAFSLSNPFVLIYFSDFIRSVMVEKAIMTFGHRVQATSGAETWVLFLIQMMGIPSFLVLVCVVGCKVVQRQLSLRVDCLVLAVWFLTFLAYLMLEANLKRPRHLLPIVPVLTVFIGWAYVQVWDWSSQKYDHFAWLKWVGVIAVVTFSTSSLMQSIELYYKKYDRENDRVEIMVGRWLAENFSDETSVAFDAYSYVPRKFQNVYRTFGMTYQMVNHFEPDLLVVRDAIKADFDNPSEAQYARIGVEAYMDHHYFYCFLEEGSVPDYRLVRDFDQVAIYERVRPKVRSEGDARQLWRMLVLREREGRRYGQVEALWTMGWIQHSLGNVTMASETWARLEGMNNDVKRLYSHGLRLLQIKDYEAARFALDMSMGRAKKESVAFQAGMREDLAYRYLKIQKFKDAVRVAEDALRLTNKLPVAVFERAVGYIAMGQTAYGTQLLEDAVAQFGAHEKGRQLLESMMLMQIEAETMQNLQIRFYGNTP